MEPLTEEAKELITLSIFEEPSQRYGAFFALYKDLLTLFEDSQEFANDDRPGPTRLGLSHQDVINTLSILRSNVRATREELEECLRDRGAPCAFSALLSVAVQTMAMVDPNAGQTSGLKFPPTSYRPSPWLPREPLVYFLGRSFDEGSEYAASPERIAPLTAWNLQKRTGVVFRRTDDLREHLIYDPRSHTLFIFHQVCLLKNQLKRAKKRGLKGYHRMESSLPA